MELMVQPKMNELEILKVEGFFQTHRRTIKRGWNRAEFSTPNTYEHNLVINSTKIFPRSLSSENNQISLPILISCSFCSNDQNFIVWGSWAWESIFWSLVTPRFRFKCVLSLKICRTRFTLQFESRQNYMYII